MLRYIKAIYKVKGYYLNIRARKGQHQRSFKYRKIW